MIIGQIIVHTHIETAAATNNNNNNNNNNSISYLRSRLTAQRLVSRYT
jgi:hypothetical protein